MTLDLCCHPHLQPLFVFFLIYIMNPTFFSIFSNIFYLSLTCFCIANHTAMCIDIVCLAILVAGAYLVYTALLFIGDGVSVT